MRADPCGKCGRTLLDLRQGASREALRGSAPLCSVPACPLVKQVLGFAEWRVPSGLELHGPSPPAVFVGRHGYPNVTLGPLLPATPESAPVLGASPEQWTGLGIAEILEARSRLFRSKAPVKVDARHATRALEASRELAMSARPVDTEVTLAKPPRLASPEPRVDPYAAPMGPSVDVVDARILEHVNAPRRVDALVSDVHADAATATWELYDGGIGVEHIQRLLSVGLLGESQRRKLVPTRWSITATDDILGKQLLEDVRTYDVVDAPQVFSSELFGNHFHVVLLPRVWSYEMLEAWQENGGWKFGRDAEGHQGRTSYVEQVAGAYYAARLSVLEHLEQRKRQAAAFVLREITEDYWAPLGVWVIREAVRSAMQGKGLAFGDIDSAMRHVLRRSRNKEWPPHASLPREARAQRTLKEFLEGG